MSHCFVRLGLFRWSLGLSVAVGLFFGVIAVNAQNGTRMLRMPTVSSTQIAFAYAQNIWVVPRSGGSARRLTSFQGQSSNPHFSPDGKWIAFSSEYAGNQDVYLVSADGGEPKRLTWHPGADLVQGWTPDGNRSCFLRPEPPGRQAVHRVFGLFLRKAESKNRWHFRVDFKGKFLPTGQKLPIG
ncbi:MAG TPA: hypothetical protein PKY82_09180 [Pyrinomonadaceae bacterium]|nr:hypothetical protein [Pyrinomonadaceae bacterium]